MFSSEYIPYIDKPSRVRGIAVALVSTLFPLAIGLFLVGWYTWDFGLMLTGVTVQFCVNIVYAALNLRGRLMFFFLHCGIALFLLTRPWIASINPKLTWELSSPETTFFALASIFLSMVCLLLGDALYTQCLAHNDRVRKRIERMRVSVVGERYPSGDRQTSHEGKKSQKNRHNVTQLMGLFTAQGHSSEVLRGVQVSTFILFVICFLGSMVAGAILVVSMHGHRYEDFYITNPGANIPSYIDILSVMLPYMMCGYLATMPKRRLASVVLALYVVSTVPMLIIGSRAAFVLALLFAALYFCFRHLTDKKEIWLTHRLLVIVAILAPIGIFGLGMIDYLRSDKANPDLAFVQQILDALYKQGVSFTVLGHGYDVNNDVQSLGFRFFSLGGFISNITTSFFGQNILGFPDLGSTNSPELALHGNYYAHTMSYFAHPNYLHGEGYGSSYILELFADFGFAGIALGSVVIAIAFAILTRQIGKSWFGGLVALYAAITVFHIPRGYTSEWFDYLITTRFWLAMALVIVLGYAISYLLRLRAAHKVDIPQEVSCAVPVAQSEGALDRSLLVPGVRTAHDSSVGLGHLVCRGARGEPSCCNHFDIELVPLSFHHR